MNRRFCDVRRFLRDALSLSMLSCLLCWTTSHSSAQTSLERLEQELGIPFRSARPVRESSPTETGQERLPPPASFPPLPVGPIAESSDELVAFLGVSTVEVKDAPELDPLTPVATGAVVDNVFEGTGAEEAEIAVGSVIVALDGRRVDAPRDLMAHLQRYRPGEEVTVLLYQGAKLERKRVQLAGIQRELLSGTGLTQSMDALASEAERVNRPQVEPPTVVGVQDSEAAADERDDTEPSGPLRILGRGARRDGGLIGRIRDAREANERSEEDTAAEAATGALVEPSPSLPAELTVQQLLEIIDYQQRQIDQLERRVRQLEQTRGQ